MIPDNEREVCFHKESCTFKPHCIFFHPEGQGDDGWKQDRRNPAKLCRYTENGGTCMRSLGADNEASFEKYGGDSTCEDLSDSEESDDKSKQGGNSRFRPVSKRNGSGLENKSKRKRNRRKERKRNKINIGH